MKTTRDHEIAFQLAAGQVDAASGVIRGVVVAKAGVKATGKYVFVDDSGKVTKDPSLAKKKLAVFTDDEFLETLMGAIQDAGGKLKVRSDHDDSIAARAGYADTFRRDGEDVKCDLHLNDSYRDRAVVLEVAAETPQLIGLSIDFTPNIEIKGGKALLRVTDISAVDIVDEGAVTPGGLFLRKEVDTDSKEKTSTEINTTMAKTDNADDPIAQCLSALKGLADGYTALSSKVDANMAKMSACMDSIAEFGKKVSQLSSEKESETLTAQKNEITALLSSVTDAVVSLKKEKAALGLRATKGGEGDGADAAAESERARLAAEAAKNTPKDFLALVKEEKALGKLSASECNRKVMKEHPGVYAEYLAKKGIAKTAA